MTEPIRAGIRQEQSHRFRPEPLPCCDCKLVTVEEMDPEACDCSCHDTPRNWKRLGTWK